MTDVTDLVEWLRAQLDDDERIARAQQRFDAERDAQRGDDVMGILVPPMSLLGSPGDPARVLAEVDAKRRILDEYDNHRTDPNPYPPEWQLGKVAALESVARLLALPYADRDGYRQEWAPA